MKQGSIKAAARLGNNPECNTHVRELFSLKDRVALVTGGSGHCGQQISRALAEAGATVIIASRNRARCERLARSLRETKLDAQALHLDLTRDKSIRSMAKEIKSRWGGLDILFNNAVTLSTGSFGGYAGSEWARVMECNSLGLFRACSILGALMSERRSGSIVNIGSIYGVVSPDFRIYSEHPEMTSPPSYAFAKGGMIQLTRYLAIYFAPLGVRVNCLSPGGLISPQLSKQFEASYCRRTPLGRMAGPNDLKGAAVFLASDASAYITGQNLLVDGGYTAL